MNKIITFFITVFIFSIGITISYAEVQNSFLPSTTATTQIQNYLFTSTLRYGMTNGEVYQLQQSLLNDGYLQGSVDGKFFRQTFNAVVRFQLTNDLKADGIVGVATRAVLNKVVVPTPKNVPTVLSPNGSENWTINSTHQITWKVNDGNQDTKVDIYLGSLQTQHVTGCSDACPLFSLFTYVLDKNIPSNTTYNWIVGTDMNNYHIPLDNYVVTVCIAGTNNCDSSNQIFTISTDSPLQPSVTVTSPNGGENWNYNSVRPITWNINNRNQNTKVDIYLETQHTVNCLVAPCQVIFGSPTYVLDRNISNYTSYNWIAMTDIDNKVIPSGTYGLKVCITNTNTCDYSDGPFTLVGHIYPI